MQLSLWFLGSYAHLEHWKLNITYQYLTLQLWNQIRSFSILSYCGEMWHRKIQGTSCELSANTAECKQHSSEALTSKVQTAGGRCCHIGIQCDASSASMNWVTKPSLYKISITRLRTKVRPKFPPMCGNIRVCKHLLTKNFHIKIIFSCPQTNLSSCVGAYTIHPPKSPVVLTWHFLNNNSFL